MSDEQLGLDFGWKPWTPTPMPEQLTCILRWNAEREMVESFWPLSGTWARFQDWRVALDHVLHPLNTHVKLKVRP